MKDLKSLLIGVMKMTWKPTFQRCCCGKLILCFRSHFEGTHLCSFFCKSNHSAFIIPPAQQSCWGVYWFHLVRLSVRDVGRSVVFSEDQLYWRQLTGIDGNYRSRKITARRWLHMSEQNAVHLASPDTYIKYAIQMSVCLSVHQSRIPCPLWSSYSSKIEFLVIF